MPGWSGRLDLPPPADALAAIPASFGRRFLLFVDTEEEFDWQAPFRRDATATGALRALPEAQRRFRAMGVAPAYLVDYPVAADPCAVDAIGPALAAGEASIGAQLHPWVNPPFEEVLNEANSFVGNLPEAIEAAKLAALVARIAEAFGQRPCIYRAGRYGLGPHSAALLEKAGFHLDVSVRALFDYRDAGGPDFSAHPVLPWWAGPRRELLELPLGATWIGRWRHRGAPLYRAAGSIPRFRGLLDRLGLVSRIALTPEEMPLPQVLRAIRTMLDGGVRLFSFSFHSPSLEPGHTPYVRDAADLDRFWRWWDGVLDLLAREGVAPARAEDLIEAARAARRAQP